MTVTAPHELASLIVTANYIGIDITTCMSDEEVAAVVRFSADLTAALNDSVLDPAVRAVMEAAYPGECR